MIRNLCRKMCMKEIHIPLYVHTSKIKSTEEIKKYIRNTANENLHTKKSRLFENKDEHLEFLEEIQFNSSSAHYTRYINNFIEKPYFAENYEKQIEKQPQLCREIINNCGVSIKLIANPPIQNIMYAKEVINLFKFINFSTIKFYILLVDDKVQQLIESMMKVFSLINDIQELTLFVEEIIVYMRSLTENNFNEFASNFIKTATLYLEKQYTYFLKSVNLIIDQDNDEYLLKYVIVLSKMKKIISGGNLNNDTIFNDQLLKSFESRLFQLKYENLGILKTIEFLQNLHYLNFNEVLSKIIRLKILYKSHTLDSFHLFYTSVLKYYPDSIQILNLFENLSKNKSLLSMSLMKITNYSETIEFLIERQFHYLSNYNQNHFIIKQNIKFVEILFSQLNEELRENSTPNQVLTYAIFSLKYLSNNNNSFSKVSGKKIDFLEVDTENLLKFSKILNERLKNIWSFDHEIYLLKKINKDNYLITNQYLELFVQNLMNSLFYYFERVPLKEQDVKYYEIFINCFNFQINLYNNCEAFELSQNLLYKLKKFVEFSSENIIYIFIKMIEKSEELVADFTKIFVNLHYFSKENKPNNQKFLENYIMRIINILSHENCIEKIDFKTIVNIYTNLLEFFISFEKEDILKLSTPSLKAINQLLNQIHVNIFKNKDFNINVFTNNNLDDGLICNFLLNYSFLIKELGLTDYNIELIEQYFDQSNILRFAKSNYLFKITESTLTKNCISQILSNMQTLIVFPNKNNQYSNYMNKQNLKKLINNLVNSIENYKIKENSSEYNVSALSSVSSIIIESFNLEELCKMLKLLGRKNQENFHPTIIVKLNEVFNNKLKIEDIAKSDKGNLINLCCNWPLFLKNNYLKNEVLKIIEDEKYFNFGIHSFLSYFHIIHPKLTQFCISHVNNITDYKNKKNSLDEIIQDCSYVGTKLTQDQIEQILNMYLEIQPHIPIEINESSDLLCILKYSKIDFNKLNQNQINFIQILKDKVYKTVSNELSLIVNDKKIFYYRSIESEDKFYHKSNSNVLFKMNRQQENQQETNSDSNFRDKKTYSRKAMENSMLDQEFENFFSKKKNILEGKPGLIEEDHGINPIVKYLIISKLLNFDIPNSTLDDEFTEFCKKLKTTFKRNTLFEMLYLNLSIFWINNKLKTTLIDTEELKGMSYDYLILKNEFKYAFFFIEKKNTSINVEGCLEIDGFYRLFFYYNEKTYSGLKCVPIFESNLEGKTQDQIQLFLKNLFEEIC